MRIAAKILGYALAVVGGWVVLLFVLDAIKWHIRNR